MNISKALSTVVCALGVLAVVPNAHAGYITAYGWVSTQAITSSSTAATVATLALGTCHVTAACTIGNADVTFTTTGVNFTPPDNATMAQWLASNAFPLDGLVNNTAPATLLSPSIWEFVGNTQVTGTTGSPQAFTFEHDDGMTFIVNGQTVVNAPGPTAPIVTVGSYTGGASTNAPFVLIYAERGGIGGAANAAILQTDLIGPGTAPVPEPTSIGLLGIGLTAVLLRRKLR